MILFGKYTPFFSHLQVLMEDKADSIGGSEGMC